MNGDRLPSQRKFCRVSGNESAGRGWWLYPFEALFPWLLNYIRNVSSALHVLYYRMVIKASNLQKASGRAR